MKPASIILPIAAGIAALSTPATAQNGPALAYSDTIKCGAFYALLTALAEEDPNGKAAAVALDDIFTRWAQLSIIRDGSNGDRSGQDMSAAVEKLADDLAAAGEDEQAIEALLDGIGDRCIELEEIHAAEFEAVDVAAIQAEDALDQ